MRHLMICFFMSVMLHCVLEMFGHLSVSCAPFYYFDKCFYDAGVIAVCTVFCEIVKFIKWGIFNLT